MQNSAVTWNTVFVWLLLHFSSAKTHAHTGQKVIDDRFFFFVCCLIFYLMCVQILVNIIKIMHILKMQLCSMEVRV